MDKFVSKIKLLGGRWKLYLEYNIHSYKGLSVDYVLFEWFVHVNDYRSNSGKNINLCEYKMDIL